ncbi:hypothetical protein MPER_14703, partial [Moniliophthora perniciosa FA553]
MSPSNCKVIVSSRVLLPDSEELCPAAIIIDSETGKITGIRLGRYSASDSSGSFPSDAQWVDVGDKVVLPGLVEYFMSSSAYCSSFIIHPSAHVHLNEPGRTDWEGFYTGTKAAISGGITTVVDMPLNSIPPT